MLKIFAEFGEASVQSQPSNSRNSSTCHILTSIFSKISKQEFFPLALNSLPKWSSEAIWESNSSRMEALKDMRKSCPAADNEYQYNENQRKRAHKLWLPCGLWEPLTFLKGKTGKFLCTQQALPGGTNTRPLQMKNPPKQQAFLRETNFHRPAAAESASNNTGPCWWYACLLKMNWITSL